MCIPAACNSMKKGVLTAKAEKVFRVALAQCSPQIWEALSENTQYYATDFTRFYIPYRDKILAKKRFELLKERLIAGRKLLIVEGEYTRNGVGNDLLNSATRIRRIVCPARDAFEHYDEILTSIIKFCESDELVLLSLGPTATVLAYDLAEMGIWAIDFGHMDIEYEWCIREVEKKISIPGKHVNEVTGDQIVGGVNKNDLNEYETQIIFRVGL